MTQVQDNLFQVTESVRVAVNMTSFVYMPSEMKFVHNNVYKLGCGHHVFSYGIACIFFKWQPSSYIRKPIT